MGADHPRRQTLGGAYERSRDRLEIINRQLEQDRPNLGRPGRRNATRDEQRQGELPWLQPKPLSGW